MRVREIAPHRQSGPRQIAHGPHSPCNDTTDTLCPVRHVSQPKTGGRAGTLGTIALVFLLVFGVFGNTAIARDRYEPPATGDLQATPEAVDEAPVSSSVKTPAPVDTTTPVSAISAPAVEDEGVPQENVRARPDLRPVDIAATVGSSPTATEEPAGVPRLDEPVLRWLPEILASAEEAGVPPELIAGVMRLESNGNPNIISPAGARGLMQIMPEGLIGMGIPESSWHDPATNIRAGAFGLAQRAIAQGSWEGAVGAYFGFGCDVFGTCTATYISVVFGWASYYYGAVHDPYNSGYAVLGSDWVPPEIAPFVEAAPVPVQTAPPTTPTPIPSVTITPTGTPIPGTTPVPTEGPTDVPTEVPTAEPTEVPTAEPTEIPTEVPTEVPTEEPVAPPDDSGTPPA